MTAGWCSRTVRAAVFAAVCVLLAALGHVVMSGQSVPSSALVGGLAATGGLGWCLAGRERGLLPVVAVVVAVQTVLHTAFSLAQSGTAAAGHAAHAAASAARGHHHTGSGGLGQTLTGAMDGMAMSHGHGAYAESAGHMASLGTPSAGDLADVGRTLPLHHLNVLSGDSSSLGMFAAHLLAALLTGLWLAHGERAAFRILRAVAGRLTAPLRLLLALPAPPHRPRLRGRRQPSRISRLLVLVYAIVLRGPPVGTAAA
ncbi:hypothetical protein SSP531S_04290 [Streptomyces spongiicola]|uniref:PE-PGRS family protein n=1 Tax=Streptomyces spongiicola TaxID=1690221 RepID=A0A388SVL0_9ACTN|nr:hypothetical protein [Streptomyces spongiicola]GBP99034.1 hypothetical protein SSP531S_04290 [Streptomyces spongiicola]